MTSLCHGQTKVGVWSDSVEKKWWQQFSTPAQWVVEEKVIHEQLLTIHERLGVAKVMKNPHFVGWLNHLKWLSLFPDQWEQDPWWSQPEARRTFQTIALQKELRNAFLEALSRYDNHSSAIEILSRIYQKYPKEAVAYPSLAVAFSIVFDQPFPKGWPHHFVQERAVLNEPGPIEERFAFYVKSHQEKKLAYDLKRMSSDDLKFVVDTPVPLKELQHVQRVKLRNVKQLNLLFTMIRYDQVRLNQGGSLWPHGKYELFMIQKNGGLCVDQAYYTAHTAKSKGIPTIFFLGQGNSGEHAWLGFWERHGKWKFDLAKFQNEDYPVGQAFDPQSWRRLTDSECAFLDRQNSEDPGRVKAKACLRWAELNEGSPVYHATVREARLASPGFIRAWEAEAGSLDRSEVGIEEQLRFWREWNQTFQKQKDLLFRGQKRLLNLLEEAGRTNEYNTLLKKIIDGNKRERSDLVVSIAAERVFVLVEKKEWEKAHDTFRKTMSKLRTKAGGHLFYRLVQPYVNSCLEEGKMDHARDAIERAMRASNPQRGSLLEQDLKALERLVKSR